MHLDPMALQSFVALAETGSFTKAAERVGRTQSAVSQQISRLEEILGAVLLVRKRKVSLTEAGEVLLSYARRMLQLQQEVLERFREPELQGEVCFGLPEDFATVFLADVLVEFSQSHPRIMLNVECDLTLNLLARFRDQEFDLVLLKMSRPEDFPNGVEVWSETLEWVGRGEPEVEEQRARGFIPLVLSPKPCVYRARTTEALEKVGLPWRIVYTSPSFAGTIAAVKAGLGLTVLPKNMIPAGLHALKNRYLPDLKDTHISLLTKEPCSKAVQSFAEHILKRLH